jgi:hypothetical protein
MRALMTNIPQVNIWAEAEAFFDSISHADIALRILAATEAAQCDTKRSSSPLGQWASADCHKAGSRTDSARFTPTR